MHGNPFPQPTPAKSGLRGFTLVELMMVVAIIGILATLALYGLRRYLIAAEISEAEHTVGQISRSAHSAFERELMQSQQVAEGAESITAAHLLCASAPAVPKTVPAGKKYQPSTKQGDDFNTGTDSIGWACLRFELNQPIYYQYAYTKGASPMAPGNPAACAGDCYEAGARGDLNGNGITSEIARTGHINTATGRLKASTIVFVDRPAE